MKIRGDHYERLKQAIEPNRDKIASHRAFIIQEGKAKDVEKRLRWDLFWAIPATVRTSLMDDIYKYANDMHMDTALRAVVRELECVAGSQLVSNWSTEE